MTCFAQRVIANDVLDVEHDRVFDVLADPDCLATLTPLVARIDTNGDRWTWQLVEVSALGVTATARFTTLMDIGTDAIRFRPAPDVDERASATGHLEVTPEADGRTRVAIDLTATVELPLPRMMSRPVTAVMFATMRGGGSRFADNLLDHLGNPGRRGMEVRAADPVSGRTVAA
ncbi:hypothetical protein [Euzebya rosea]|uniref:hypothetical protein n=1 Tax=Euzebya rosea TaxID=2052804 RepID=UPI001300AD6C|nr:hypothetical protein [Euzebya rosea]